MSRYKNNKILTDSDGNRYRSSTIYNPIPYDRNDMYVEAGQFERLDNISHQYYKTRDYWWIIALANSIGKGTLSLKEGGILRLPANPGKIASNLKNLRY